MDRGTVEVVGVAIAQALALAWVHHRVRTEPTTRSEPLRLGALLGPMARNRPVAWALKRVEGWDDVAALFGILVVVCCLYIGADLYEDIAEEDRIVRIDAWISEWLDRWRSPIPVRAAEWVSLATGPYGSSTFAVATLVVLLWCRKWVTAASLAFAGVGAAISTIVVKAALARGRPPGVEIYHPHGDAFPSGHTSGTAYVAFVVAWLVSRRRGRTQRSWAFAAACVLIALVGAARMYLAVHWMSDILGGAALGLAWATVAVLVARRV